MKIALLSEKYTPDVGGLAISAERLAGLLAEAGHALQVIAPSQGLPPSRQQTLHHGPLRVTRFGAHKRIDDTLVDWFELLVSEHRKEPFDLLHAYFLTQAGFIAAYAGRYLGIPSVVSARGNDLERAVFDPGRAAHVFYALQHAGAVTANARELVRKAEALAPGIRASLIPNGIDTHAFRPLEPNPELVAALGLQGGPVLGFVGELREKKGLQDLLSAYALVAARGTASLLIVGDIRPGQDRARFDEFRAANTALPITVTGFVSPKELAAYYALLDIVVMPSLRDGLPNALLEAMACGRPVIATPVGGIPDALSDRENGRLVPAGDPRALADCISELLAEQALARQFGLAARDTIVSRFTRQAELDGNLDIYRQLGLKG
jgi:glycosyltransferase involved in cell wall biosynthesis